MPASAIYLVFIGLCRFAVPSPFLRTGFFFRFVAHENHSDSDYSHDWENVMPVIEYKLHRSHLFLMSVAAEAAAVLRSKHQTCDEQPCYGDYQNNLHNFGHPVPP
jgi:hypothetical protein